MFNVNEGGPADQLGLKAGEVIVEVDGQPLLLTDLKEVRKDEDQKLTMVSKEGARRTVEIKAGLLGINTRRVVRPELMYLRSGLRDPKWDRFAAVGAAECLVNPDLAETAWANAFDAGYAADAVSDFCDAEIAWRQGRNESALRFLDSLNARPNVPNVLADVGLDYQLAVANNRPKQAADAVRPTLGLAFPGQTRRYLAGMAELQAPAPSELVTARGVSTLLTSMTPLLDPTNSDQRNSYREHMSDWFANDRRPTAFDAPLGRVNEVRQPPTVDAPDVELVVRGTMKPFEATQVKAHGCFS